MKLNLSSKYTKISQANNFIFIVIAAAAVVTVFSAVTARTLLSQIAFQRRVLSAKSDTVKQLSSNLESEKKLQAQYQIFANSDPNILGGSKSGSGPKDGDNPRIALDALPSTYDFPALVASLEKIVSNSGIQTQVISGIDNESSTKVQSSGKPEPQIMNFSVDGTSSYNGVQTLVKDFERSIRPFDFVSFSLSGNESSMRFTINANTYYQPPKTFTLSAKEVK